MLSWILPLIVVLVIAAIISSFGPPFGFFEVAAVGVGVLVLRWLVSRVTTGTVRGFAKAAFRHAAAHMRDAKVNRRAPTVSEKC